MVFHRNLEKFRRACSSIPVCDVHGSLFGHRHFRVIGSRIDFGRFLTFSTGWLKKSSFTETFTFAITVMNALVDGSLFLK